MLPSSLILSIPHITTIVFCCHLASKAVPQQICLALCRKVSVAEVQGVTGLRDVLGASLVARQGNQSLRGRCTFLRDD
eukprot:8661775-Karenia_brevis.AAC.1